MKNYDKNITERGNIYLKEDEKKENLTRIEIDNVIDETINISVISKLKDLKIITEKQFYTLKEKIKSFY